MASLTRGRLATARSSGGAAAPRFGGRARGLPAADAVDVQFWGRRPPLFPPPLPRPRDVLLNFALELADGGRGAFPQSLAAWSGERHLLHWSADCPSALHLAL